MKYLFMKIPLEMLGLFGSIFGPGIFVGIGGVLAVAILPSLVKLSLYPSEHERAFGARRVE